jgi:hypothetical protein
MKLVDVGTGWVARVVLTVLEACVGRPLEVPISKRLCNSATLNGKLAPWFVTFESLTVDEARVEEVAISFRAVKNGLYLFVEDVFIMLEVCFSRSGAVWWQARLTVALVEDYCIILGV